MATQPVWITPAGSLGTVPEGAFYQVPLQVTDSVTIAITSLVSNGNTVTVTYGALTSIPFQRGDTVVVASVNPSAYNGNYTATSSSLTQTTFTCSVTDAWIGGGTVSDIPSTVYFEPVAGALPSGIECTLDGVIQGVPNNIVTVADEVVIAGRNVTSKFAIRAYTETVVNNIIVVNRLADRTFTITVAGQNAPQWITPPGRIGEYWDGELLEPGLQLQYVNDNNTGVPPAISLVSGRLPPGLTLSSTGLISGYIGLNPIISTTPGFSRAGQGFSVYPFDFNAETQNANYEFVLRVTDGKTSALQTFSMFVWSTATFTADTTLITADDSYLTASIANVNVPVLNNIQGSIGSAPSDTFFAYKFTGEDINGDEIRYSGLNIPPGLYLDPVSGWLSGYLPGIGLTETVYNFKIQVYIYATPSVISDPYQYSLTSIGPISTEVIWVTPSNLGSIVNGGTSLFYVEATTTAGLPLEYRLESGSDSTLPQGLTLLPSGNIVGRVSFNIFTLDSGATTIDRNSTTFDLTYTFTVNAYSVNGYVNVFKSFTINVVPVYNTPYNNLYIECMPPVPDRQLIGNLLQNISIFTPSLIYRPDDYNFGVSDNVIYYHAYGLNAVSLNYYIESLQLNHYWKNLTLGKIKTAQAVDPVTGKVIYEVVYSEVIDNLVNNNGVSVGKEVVLPYAITETISWIWDPAKVGPNIILSNNNLTAAANSSDNEYDSVLGNYAITPGTKVMFSLTQEAWAPEFESTGIGIGNASTNIQAWVGYDNNSGGFYDDGTYWTNGNNLISGYPAFEISPLIIDVAVDRVNNLMWIRVNGGLWNNSTVADPGAALGGVDISNIAGDVYPCYTPYYYAGIGSQATINPSALYGVPLGYTFIAVSTSTDVVYPNALTNMRDQVIDVVGQESDMLPLWMLSTQSNGHILGFTPAWVIAYTVPGASGQIQYNIETQFGTQLNQIDFEADRYELDNALTQNWDADTQQWIPTPPTSTTFDINYHYTVFVQSAGTGYRVGDRIKILGTSLGGASPYNDAVMTVDTVNNAGGIVNAFYEGTASVLAYNNSYTNIAGINITGTGSGARWDLIIVPGLGATIPAYVVWNNDNNQQLGWYNNYFEIVNWGSSIGTTVFDTQFDGGSLTFTAPADRDTNTNAYDKYLLFPKKNILQSLPQTGVGPYPGPGVVYWINEYNELISWVNNLNQPIPWAHT